MQHQERASAVTFLPHVRGAIARIVRDARGADPRAIRTLSYERDWQRVVARATVPIALRLLAASRTLLSSVLERCEGTNEAEPTASPSVSGTYAISLDAGAHALVDLADMCFLVQLELRERESRLAGVGANADPITVIGECEGAFRRICRGLAMLDRAIANIDGTTPSLDADVELRESLVVRRAYARLRTFFRAQGEVPEGSIEGALRMAAARIDTLVDGQVGALMRVRDRLHVLEIQERLVSWLKCDERASVDGARIWQDLLAFVEMLALINRRQELVAHDQRLVAVAARDTLRDDRWRASLDPLMGLDPALDELLDGGTDEAIQAELRRLEGRPLPLRREVA